MKSIRKNLRLLQYPADYQEKHPQNPGVLIRQPPLKVSRSVAGRIDYQANILEGIGSQNQQKAQYMDLQNPQFPEQTNPGKIGSSGNAHLPLFSAGNPKINHKTNQEYSEEFPLGRIRR